MPTRTARGSQLLESCKSLLEDVENSADELQPHAPPDMLSSHMCKIREVRRMLSNLRADALNLEGAAQANGAELSTGNSDYEQDC